MILQFIEKVGVVTAAFCFILIIQSNVESILLGNEDFYHQEFFFKTVSTIIILELFLFIRALRKNLPTTTDKINVLLFSFVLLLNGILRFIMFLQIVLSEVVRSGTYLMVLVAILAMSLSMYPLISSIRSRKNFQIKKQVKTSIVCTVIVFILVFLQIIIAFYTYPLKIF